MENSPVPVGVLNHRYEDGSVSDCRATPPI